MTRIQQTETKVLFLRDCPATGACMCAGWCNEIEYEIPIEDWKTFLEKYKTNNLTNIKFDKETFGLEINDLPPKTGYLKEEQE